MQKKISVLILILVIGSGFSCKSIPTHTVLTNFFNGIYGGGSALPDKTFPVTFFISFCNIGITNKSPVTVLFNYNDVGFKCTGWGWKGKMPYVSAEKTKDLIVSNGSPATAIFQNGISNGCVTLLIAFENDNWPSYAGQSFRVESRVINATGSGSYSGIFKIPKFEIAPVGTSKMR